MCSCVFWYPRVGNVARLGVSVFSQMVKRGVEVKYLFFCLSFFVPVVSVANDVSAWPVEGEVFVKGCEETSNAVTQYYALMNREGAKRGDNVAITARVCLVGVLHMRLRVIIVDVDDGTKTIGQIYSTAELTVDKKTKERVITMAIKDAVTESVELIPNTQ